MGDNAALQTKLKIAVGTRSDVESVDETSLSFSITHSSQLQGNDHFPNVDAMVEKVEKACQTDWINRAEHPPVPRPRRAMPPSESGCPSEGHSSCRSGGSGEAVGQVSGFKIT